MELILKTLKASGILLASFCIFSCNNGGKSSQDIGISGTKKDSANTDLVKLNNQIFSIPSPIQTVLLIKKGGYNYDKKILNSSDNYNKYDTRYKKALNLGIYGADLGYISLYNQNQDAMLYLASIEKLASDVGVAQAFNPDLIKRFQANMGVQDSLLNMVSDAYRLSDAFFKDNNQKDISSLIIVGGWIESLYFATQENVHSTKDELVKRIAEQKISLQNLLKMLLPYKNKAEYSELVIGLTGLSNDFDNVEFVYNYVAPTVDAKNKVTSINSTSEVKISPEQLKDITDKIQTLRNQIAG